MLSSSNRDIKGIQLPLHENIITLEGMAKAYREIQSRMGKFPYHHIDPQRFVTRYVLLYQQLKLYTYHISFEDLTLFSFFYS